MDIKDLTDEQLESARVRYKGFLNILQDGIDMAIGVDYDLYREREAMYYDSPYLSKLKKVDDEITRRRKLRDDFIDDVIG